MLARAIFEVNVDLEILSVDSSAAAKMAGFQEVERLKVALKVVEFQKHHRSTINLPTGSSEAFIGEHRERIELAAKILWPGMQFRNIRHWTGETLPARVQRLNDQTRELYACFYKQLSWSVHGGLQGIAGMQAESFPRLCGFSYQLAEVTYQRLVTTVFQKFQLEKHDPLLNAKLQLARYLPFTDGEESERALRKELGLF